MCVCVFYMAVMYAYVYLCICTCAYLCVDIKQRVVKEGIREEIEKLSFYTRIILLYGSNKNLLQKKSKAYY